MGGTQPASNRQRNKILSVQVTYITEYSPFTAPRVTQLPELTRYCALSYWALHFLEFIAHGAYNILWDLEWVGVQQKIEMFPGGVLRFELDRGVPLESQNPYPSLR